MKLYILKTDEFEYDEYDGFVIRATSPAKARQIAGKKESRWLDATRSTCNEVKEDGPEGFILESFNAG